MRIPKKSDRIMLNLALADAKERRETMPIEVDEITAPACWASALVNGDRSGLSDDEESALDVWLSKLEGWHVVDVARDSDGNPQESRFTWSFDIYGGTARGGDVLDYVIHRNTGNLDQEPSEFLAQLFETEYCAECGGDAEHHTAIPFMGNWFARCDYPADENTGELHSVVKTYRDKKES